MTGLQSLMAPRSVAIIGASEDPTRIGGRTLTVLRGSGFGGPVYPVNARRSAVQGLPAFPTVADIPGPVDCAIIAIPADGVLAAVADCARHGVGTVILFSAGFAETGAEGRALQDEIVRVARAGKRPGGTRVLGPNCTGAYNLASGAYLSFYDSQPRPFAAGRNIGVVSQSGGYGAHIITLARRRNLSVGHFVTTGNESDIEIGEVLGTLAADPAVNVLVGYVEGIRDPDSFLAALALAWANRKPVILMKSGASPAGASAASSHTGSLAGFDAAYDAVFREYGVHRAGSTEEVLDIAYAAAHTATRGRLPAGRRVAVMTNSGGMGVQMADHAAHTGLELAQVPAEAQARIFALVPNGSARNPVDFTAQWLAEPHLISGCLSALLETAEFDAVFCFMGSSGSNPVVLAEVGPLLARHPGAPVVMCISVDEDCATGFEAAGCLVFEEPVRAMRAVAALAGFAAHFDRVPAGRPAPSGHRALPSATRWNEHDAKQVLAAWGLTVPREAVAATPDAAADAARVLAAPVCLKILSADIAHKTEVGGVALGLEGEVAVRYAAAAMLDTVRQRRPDARIDGFLVGPMLTGGVECIVGAHPDPVFGPLVMVGMGGIGVELLKDVAWRRAPVGMEEAEAMVRELRLAPLLLGHRGRAAADLGALCRAIAAISRLAAENAGRIRTVEINPILVMPGRGGAVVLDAVIETFPEP